MVVALLAHVMAAVVAVAVISEVAEVFMEDQPLRWSMVQVAVEAATSTLLR
jgi:hypothetical protein